MNITEAQKRIDKLNTETTQNADMLKLFNKQKLQNGDDLINAQKIRELVYLAVDKTQSQLRYHVSNLVTVGLQTTFPEKDYKFHLDFVTRRNQTECDLLIEDGGIKSKPKYRNGGGVLDVISISLRMAFWSLSDTVPILALDEPSKFVSKDKQDSVVQMIRDIADELNIQIILVTHIPELMNRADKVIEIQNGKIIRTVDFDDRQAETTHNIKIKKKRKR